MAVPSPMLQPNRNRDARTRALLHRAFALALLLGAPIAAQSPGSPGIPLHLQDLSRPNFPHDPASLPETAMTAREVKLLNIERQKTIISDTQKILALARELNADSSSPDSTMSNAQRMHKADEIEKLAKNVREKMTYAITPPGPANPYAATHGAW